MPNARTLQAHPYQDSASCAYVAGQEYDHQADGLYPDHPLPGEVVVAGAEAGIYMAGLAGWPFEDTEKVRGGSGATEILCRRRF